MAFRLIFVFLYSCLVPAMLCADPLDSEFLFIKHLGKDKNKNGQVLQTFQIVCADIKVDSITVYYQENRSPALYQAEVKDACFTIFVDQPSHIRVFAIARTSHKTLLAYTDTVLFGQSKTPPERLAADQTATYFLSNYPCIELVWPERYYWNQTGQTFRFQVKSTFDTGKPNLSVLQNGRTHKLLPNRQSEFTYVSPHDLTLRKAGIQAFRNDILFTRVSDGTSEFKLTYSLMVHRSRYAFNNHGAGTVAFASSILFFAGLIVIKRKTPWWKKSG